MGQQKNSGGGKKQQSKKKTGSNKRGRNANANGADQTAKNTRERLMAEAAAAEQKMQKLLARHAAGKPGGIEENSIRHRNLQAHIANLRAAGMTTSAYAKATDAAPDAAAPETPAADASENAPAVATAEATP